MNFRTTYILFGAVAAALLAFLLYLALGTSGDADDYVFRSLREGVTKSEKISELKKAIERLEIERIQPKAPTLVFKRSGDTWKLEQPYEAKIDGGAIERIVGDLVDAKINKKADIAPKLEPLGLENPSAVVTLRKGNESYRLSLGNVTGGSGGGTVFALVSDRRKEPIAVNKRDLDGILRTNARDASSAGEALKSLTDYRPRQFVADGSPIPWDVLQRVRLKADGKEVALQRETEGGWRFLVPDSYGPADLEGDPTPVGPAAENIAGVKPLLTAISGFRMPDDADVTEGVTDFAQYGLDDGKESLRVELDPQTGGTPDLLRFGKKADEKGEKIYARLNNEAFVVKLPAKALDPVRKVIANPSVLRDRNLVTLNTPSVDAIDIKLRGEKRIELRKAGTPPAWKLFEEGSGDSFENASTAAVMELLNRLTERRQIKDFPDSAAGDKSFGVDDPAVEVAVWQNGIIPEKKEEKKEEKKDGDKKDDKKPEKKEEPKDPPIKRPTLKGEATVRLKFGKKEKDLVYVRRIVGAVSNLIALPEGYLTVAARPAIDYLDTALPSFNPIKVTKVELRRGAEAYEINKEKDEPPEPIWKITKPVGLAGRTANGDKVQRIIFSVMVLQSVKLVTRKATDAELERFGLKPPKVEVIITAKDSAETHTYQFGAETEDKKNYYAKLGGRDRVFHVAKEVVDGLFEGEIQDPTIFRIDPAKVKALKLTGWKDKALKPVTLELTRKAPGDWTAKEPADYKVDGPKLENFLIDQLYLIRADRFLTQKGAPTPEQKLDVQAGALTIEITVDGEKDPYIVTVGGLDKDGKSYFATSNKTPGAVFLLFREKFEKVRGGPDYFQKK